MFLLLGRELLSGGVPVRPPGLSKMSPRGSGLLSLAFQGCAEPLVLRWEDEAFLLGGGVLPSSCAVIAEISDPEAALFALQASNLSYEIVQKGM